MLRTSKYEKARRVVARILAAHKESMPAGSENMKKALQVEPTVNLLNKARDLMLVVSAWEVTPLVPKLESLGPVYERGVWTCKGRLGKVIKSNRCSQTSRRGTKCDFIVKIENTGGTLGLC